MDDRGLTVAIAEGFARVEGKIDVLILTQTHMKADLDRVEARVKRNEERNESLEKSRAWILGAGVGVGAVGSWLAHLISG